MANIRRMTKKRLGELLVQEGLVTDEQLEEGLAEQTRTGELLGEILVRKGNVNESDVARTIASQFSFPYLSVAHYYIGPEMRDLFSLETMEKYCFVPIDRFGDVLGIVIAGLLDQDIIDEIEKQTKSTIQIYVGKVSEVKQVIRERFAAKVERVTGDAAPAESGTDITAPPKLIPLKKSKEPDETEEEAGTDETEEKPQGAGKDDEAVMQELEQQFTKFRFFEEDKEGKEAKEAEEKKEE